MPISIWTITSVRERTILTCLSVYQIPCGFREHHGRSLGFLWLSVFRPYALDKTEAEKITNRMAPLQTFNRKRHNVQCVLVTKQPVKQNGYYNSLVTKNITLSDLMSW